MAYNTKLANRISRYLAYVPKLKIEERKMFGGLTFMVNRKMCISVSNDNIMFRFDPTLQNQVAEKIEFQKMLMKGKEYKGFCT